MHVKNRCVDSEFGVVVIPFCPPPTLLARAWLKKSGQLRGDSSQKKWAKSSQTGERPLQGEPGGEARQRGREGDVELNYKKYARGQLLV